MRYINCYDYYWRREIKELIPEAEIKCIIYSDYISSL